MEEGGGQKESVVKCIQQITFNDADSLGLEAMKIYR